jgi:hypothetical protein
MIERKKERKKALVKSRYEVNGAGLTVNATSININKH